MHKLLGDIDSRRKLILPSMMNALSSASERRLARESNIRKFNIVRLNLSMDSTEYVTRVLPDIARY